MDVLSLATEYLSQQGTSERENLTPIRVTCDSQLARLVLCEEVEKLWVHGWIDDCDFSCSSNSCEIHYLACKVESNLQWKHHILSVEEALVNVLRNSSGDGILELEPMCSYERHLVHCLADIYEVEHESVGEGEDRYMILEERWNSTIPFVRVSDYLWLLRREKGVPDTTLDLICRYDGEMEILSDGKVEYVGGETKMRTCSISTEYSDFIKILEEVSKADLVSTSVSFRDYVSGYACKVDGLTDYTSMMNKHMKNPLQPIIIWIFKEEDDSDESSGSVSMDVVENNEDETLVGA